MMKSVTGDYKDNLNGLVSKNDCEKNSAKASTMRKQNYRPEMQDDYFFKLCKHKIMDEQV